MVVETGADEVDMVIDIGAALAGDIAEVAADIATVRAAIPDAVLKVIVESAALLSLGDVQTLAAVCRAAEESGADFVKTSTGFHPAGGASVVAVEMMAGAVGGRLGVKASGGIRTAEHALAMLDAGATRLGLSGTRAVLDGLSG
jgi:deoxyribose-phosphate aldolase